jgi:hypothetical protein
MADEKAVRTAETSPEEVAYKLMGHIQHLEGQKGGAIKDRKSILDLYAECLLAVRNPTGRGSR